LVAERLAEQNRVDQDEAEAPEANGTKAMEYVEMFLQELRALDPGKTVFVMSVSPIEVRGPHLQFVRLPSLYVDSDALPVGAAVSARGSSGGVPKAYGKGVARQGFRYPFVAGNHGGPRHQMAVEAAARALWRQHRFHPIDRFGADFRHIVQRDARFMSRIGSGPGACGDDSDSHAGKNETSLMLACSPRRVRHGYRSIRASLPATRRGAARFVGGLAMTFRLLGGRTPGRDRAGVDTRACPYHAYAVGAACNAEAAGVRYNRRLAQSAAVNPG